MLTEDRTYHELDAEYICMVARRNASIESERLGQIGRIVVPDIQTGVIRAGRQLLATFRPAKAISRHSILEQMPPRTSKH